MRILFMGTPEFAATALAAIAKAYPNEVVGAVTRQDTPKNRGHAMTPPPVKILAQSLEIPVYQPANLKAENFHETLDACAPDIIIVAAYGRILPAYVLDAPRFGCTTSTLLFFRNTAARLPFSARFSRARRRSASPL